MSGDGTTGFVPREVETTPRQVVYLYKSNVNIPAQTKDVYLIGTVLLDDIDRVEALVGDNTSSIAEIESEITPIPTIEQNITEIQEVTAKMIFNLNELGIQFEFEQVNNFRDKYLI